MQPASAFSRRQPAPWMRTRGVGEVVEAWRRKNLGRCFVLDHLEPAREASLASIPADLDPALIEALKRRGIDRLYAHQARALETARRGADLVVATPTASGKSLA